MDAKQQFAEPNSMGYDDDEEMRCARKLQARCPGFGEAFSKWELKLNLNDSLPMEAEPEPLAWIVRWSPRI